MPLCSWELLWQLARSLGAVPNLHKMEQLAAALVCTLERHPVQARTQLHPRACIYHRALMSDSPSWPQLLFKSGSFGMHSEFTHCKFPPSPCTGPASGFGQGNNWSLSGSQHVALFSVLFSNLLAEITIAWATDDQRLKTRESCWGLWIRSLTATFSTALHHLESQQQP